MKTTELAGQAVGPAEAGVRAELFARVIGRIHRAFYRLTRSETEAEDLTQTTLLVLQRSLVEARYQPGRSFNTWMFLKAHSVFVGWCRERERRARELPAPGGASPDAAAAVAERLDAEAVLAEVGARLGPETHEAFVLRYEGGLTLDEVAEATECTRRTVSRRLARAHALIDALLEETP